MEKLSEFHMANQVFLQAEGRLKAINITIQELESELNSMIRLEKILIINLDILKSADVIPLIGGFKKTKLDLIKTKDRISMLRISRENHFKLKKKAEKLLKQAHDKQERAIEKLKNQDNNVVWLVFKEEK